jgi:hypothetical protein
MRLCRHVFRALGIVLVIGMVTILGLAAFSQLSRFEPLPFAVCGR